MKVILVLGMVSLAILLGVSCNPEAKAATELFSAIAAMDGIHSYRTTYEGTNVYDDTQESLIIRSRAEVAGPDIYHTWTEDQLGWREFIRIGSEAYYRAEDDPQWQVYDAQTCPIKFFYISLQQSLAPFKEATSVDVLADGQVLGVPCSHYGATCEWEADLSGTAEFWIDADGYVRRVLASVDYEEVDESAGTRRPATMTSITEVFDLNDSISISPPVLS